MKRDIQLLLITGLIFVFFSEGAELLRTYTTGSATPVLRGVSTEALTIDENGNIGIGTASPDDKLHVSAGSVTRVRVESENHTSAGVTLKNTEGTKVINTNSDRLQFNSSGQNDVVIDNTGNVGIGRTDPGYKLDVNGDTRFTGAVRFNNGLTIVKISKRIEHDPLYFDASTLGKGTYKIIVQGANMGTDNEQTLYAEYIYQDLHYSDPQLYQAMYLRNWSLKGYGHVRHTGTTVEVVWSGSRSAKISVVELQNDW